jgi:hypothetical protein
MGRIHFVGRPRAAPLCGAAEGPGWIETLRAHEVTCDRCLTRLGRAREEEAPEQEAAGAAPP